MAHCEDRYNYQLQLPVELRHTWCIRLDLSSSVAPLSNIPLRNAHDTCQGIPFSPHGTQLYFIFAICQATTKVRCESFVHPILISGSKCNKSLLVPQNSFVMGVNFHNLVSRSFPHVKILSMHSGKSYKY